MKALITGIAGFAGSHLAEYLLQEGLSVLGILRGTTDNIDHIRHRLTLYTLDLTRERPVEILQEERPELVFHLAAQASVTRAWQDPESTMINNVLAQLNLLQAVVEAEIKPGILILGSNEEYGLVKKEESPVTENNPLRPINPYGVSKIAQDMMGYQYFLSHGLRCFRLRPFPHIGPRQAPFFVAASLAKQIAEAEVGRRPPVVQVANLEASRDFTDVRDVVRGYYLALTRGEPGEVYNLGSGREISIRNILDFLLARARISISVEQEPHTPRPIDPLSTGTCDYSRFQKATDWQPQIAIEQTLGDILEYWRRQTARETR
ncbi:MAG: GDP-mannose 4,6-dehydratase [Chloroflexi bacterium]|nr:GDP-mannose 4,6-dehydratase [Chloroflexota bacterium]